MKLEFDSTAHADDRFGGSTRTSPRAKNKAVTVDKPAVVEKAGIGSPTRGSDASAGASDAEGAKSGPAAGGKTPPGVDAPSCAGTASDARSASVAKKRLLHSSPKAKSPGESVPPKKRILPKLSGDSEKGPSPSSGGNDDVLKNQCPPLVYRQQTQVVPAVRDAASGHSESVDHSQSSSGIVNRNLDADGSECAPSATAALFLHTYCGSGISSERLARMSDVLQATRRKLYVVERKLKRKEMVLRQQQGLVDELTRRVSMLECPTRRFFVSDRLPVDLLRDWHENAGRVRHARRYRNLTHQFAAGLYESSKTAYEYVSEWLPLPSLQMMRKRKEQLATVLAERAECAVADHGSMKEEDHMYAIDGVQMLSLEEAIARGLVQQETVLETTTELADRQARSEATVRGVVPQQPLLGTATTTASVDPQASSETALET